MIELSVDDLHLDYGDNPVLKGVSMNLKQGEVVSLLPFFRTITVTATGAAHVERFDPQGAGP